MEKCFVCGKPILGIEGVEATLDSFMLDSSPEGLAIAGKHYFGGCHLPCLTEDPIGRSWAKLIRRHFLENLRYTFHATRGTLELYKHPRADVFLGLKENGRHYVLSGDDLRPVPEAPSAIRVRRATVRRAIFADTSGSNAWFMQAIRRPDGLSLPEFYETARVDSVRRELARGAFLRGTVRLEQTGTHRFSPETGFDGDVSLVYEYDIPFADEHRTVDADRAKNSGGSPTDA